MQNKLYKLLRNKLLRKPALLLFLIVLLGLILRLIFFSGVGTSDDLAYSKYAIEINKGISPDSALTLSTRLGIVYATALSYRLFGINDFSSVLFPLMTSIGSIILIYYFGKLLFNEKTGLMASFLMAFFPLDLVYSARLLSDIPSAFFMSLGVYIFLRSEMKPKNSENRMIYFLSGVSIGIGYLIRETALLISLFFIIYILYKRKIRKKYFFVVLGVIFIFAVESLIFLKLTGDPLFRINASQKYLIEASLSHNFFQRLDFPIGLLAYPYMLLTNNLIFLFYIFIFIATGYIIISRKKEAYVLLFWLVPLLLYLSFGSSSLSHYIPFKATERYLTIITVPGILILAYFLRERKKIMMRFIMPFALILLFFISLYSVYLREDRDDLDNLKSLYRYIKEFDKPIYIDSRSLKALHYISGYKNNLSLNEYPDSLSNIHNSYIVINKDMIGKLEAANPGIKFPKEISKHPKAWIKVKDIGKKPSEIIVVYYAR